MGETKRKFKLDSVAIVVSILALVSSIATFYYQSVHIWEKSLIRVNKIESHFFKNQVEFELEVGFINHGNTDVLLEELRLEIVSYDSLNEKIASYEKTLTVNEVIGEKEIVLKNFSDVTYKFWNHSRADLGEINSHERLILSDVMIGTVHYVVTGGSGASTNGKVTDFSLEEKFINNITMNRSNDGVNNFEVQTFVVDELTSRDSTRHFYLKKVSDSHRIKF